jgi:hypothetical protein
MVALFGLKAITSAAFKLKNTKKISKLLHFKSFDFYPQRGFSHSDLFSIFSVQSLETRRLFYRYVLCLNL